MYRITMITDKEGVIKEKALDDLRKVHPTMKGNIIHKELLENHIGLCFLWSDDTGKMLRTSAIKKYESTDDFLIVYTRNSVYYLKKL